MELREMKMYRALHFLLWHSQGLVMWVTSLSSHRSCGRLCLLTFPQLRQEGIRWRGQNDVSGGLFLEHRGMCKIVGQYSRIFVISQPVHVSQVVKLKLVSIKQMIRVITWGFSLKCRFWFFGLAGMSNLWMLSHNFVTYKAHTWEPCSQVIKKQSTREKARSVLSKFTILWHASVIAVLGHRWLEVGHAYKVKSCCPGWGPHTSENSASCTRKKEINAETKPSSVVLLGCCFLEACFFLKRKWRGNDLRKRRCGGMGSLGEWREGNSGWDVLYEGRIYF